MSPSSPEGRARILVVIGTRPEAIKLAPVVRALREAAWADVCVLASGQHRQLLAPMLAFFGIAPDRDLGSMRDDQAPVDLLARLLPELDAVFADERPACVLAQGDTTTVFAAALACAYRAIPFAHVEAGLRSFDRTQPFPEEHHRVLIAQLAAQHFAPTEQARQNLLREGIPAELVHVVGNPVIDALHWTLPRVDPAAFQPPAGRRLLLVTAHRREHFGARLQAICRALLRLAQRGDVQVLFPVHPNPNVREPAVALLGAEPRIRLSPPLDYPDMVAAMQAAAIVLTDSGGVQEEAPSLGKPVLVLRSTTERTEGIAAGAARLVGTDPERIVAETARLLDDAAAYAAMAAVRQPYGDGRSSARIAGHLCRALAAARAGARDTAAPGQVRPSRTRPAPGRTDRRGS